MSTPTNRAWLSWRIAGTMLRWTAAMAVAVVFLAPLLWMLVASLRPETAIFQPGSLGWRGPWTLDNYGAAWRRAELGRALFNSLLQVGVITTLGLLVNALAAFAFARLEFRGRDALFAIVVMLVILPVEVVVVPLFFTARDLGLTGGYAAAMAGLTLPFLAKAFNLYFLRQHFLALPRELEESAAIDGASVWQLFWRVALPAVRPALATTVALDLLVHWGDFLWPLLISTRAETRTVQLGLANLFTQPPVDWGAILACAVIATLPVLAVFRALQRYLVPTEARAGIK